MPGIKNFDPKKDVPDLAGKVILITGGTYSYFYLLA
jgi:tRNA A37 N6-isopentenylltransferase MiaA